MEENVPRKTSDEDDIEEPMDDEEEEISPPFKMAFTKP